MVTIGIVLDDLQIDEDSTSSLSSPEEFVPVAARAMSEDLSQVDSGLAHQICFSSVLVPDDDSHLGLASEQGMRECLIPLRSLASVLVNSGFVAGRADHDLDEGVHLKEEEVGVVGELGSHWSDEQSAAEPWGSLLLHHLAVHDAGLADLLLHHHWLRGRDKLLGGGSLAVLLDDLRLLMKAYVGLTVDGSGDV